MTNNTLIIFLKNKKKACEFSLFSKRKKKRGSDAALFVDKEPRRKERAREGEGSADSGVGSALVGASSAASNCSRGR